MMAEIDAEWTISTFYVHWLWIDCGEKLICSPNGSVSFFVYCFNDLMHSAVCGNLEGVAGVSGGKCHT